VHLIKRVDLHTISHGNLNLSLYNKIVIVLREIMSKKCADRALHTLVVGSTNSASWYTYQQYSLSSHQLSFLRKILI
jgi:hypothetical protein